MSTIDASYMSLQDFDWSTRLVLSSDKISGLRKPIVQLKLDTSPSDGTLRETLLEMDLKELKILLSSLKSAQAAVQKL